jgi:hypothetical protein
MAETALAEGTATVVMIEDAIRRVGVVPDRRELIRQFAALSSGLEGDALPPYVEASLTFPYVEGARLVDRVERAGGWRAVDRAVERPPASTEQVIHGRAFRRRERPVRVRLAAGRLLGTRWRRSARAQFGEFDTEQLFRLGSSGPAARSAAAGWGGGLSELWRLGPLPARGCPAPCRPRDVLLIGWRWDSRRDLVEAARGAVRWLERGLGARRHRGAWVLRGGAGAIATRGLSLTAALAPTPALATKLARSAAPPR